MHYRDCSQAYRKRYSVAACWTVPRVGQVWEPSLDRSADLAGGCDWFRVQAPEWLQQRMRLQKVTEQALGGWWIRPDVQVCPENINWFSYQICRSDLPEWFRAEDLASVICALEALAQFVLCLLLVNEVEPESCPACLGRMILRQQCDNQGVVGASSKGTSMTQPLSGVLQATAKLCLEQGIALRISHVPGEQNSWADALSRGREVLPDFWGRLQQNLHHRVAWRQLLDDLVPRPKRLA